MAAGVTTLAAVRTAAAQRADQPTPTTTTFITLAEWLTMINASYQELYGVLAQKFGDDYFVSTSSNITTDGTNDTYDLPTDFFKGLGVDVQLTAQPTWASLRPFKFAERNRYGSMARAILRYTEIGYRFRASKLWLSPLPQSGLILRILYVPRLAALSADGDTLDLVNGWEEFIVVDAAIKAGIKEETNVTALMAERQALLARIEAEAENRDASGIRRTTDVRGRQLGNLGWASAGWED